MYSIQDQIINKTAVVSEEFQKGAMTSMWIGYRHKNFLSDVSLKCEYNHNMQEIVVSVTFDVYPAY